MVNTNESDTRNLIFFGEIPPRTNHGVSISNQINIAFLQEKLNVIIVEEFSDLKFHGRFSLSKFFAFFNSCIKFNQEVKRQNQIDIYYTVLYQSRLGILKNSISIYLFKRKFKKSPIILHVHRSDFALFYKKSFNRFLFKYVSKNTNKFLLLAQGQRDGFPVAPDKKEVIYNTIEQETNTGSKASVLPEKYNLINISNYIPQKGLPELLDALKLINNGNFILDTYGNVSDPGFYQKILVKVKSDDRIKFHDSITGRDKFDRLKQADLFICPSHNEGFPLVLLEAMSVGLPIVTTKVGFVNEMLGDDYPFYCKSNDVQSLADAIKKFMAYENKADLSEKVKMRYAKKFSRLAHKDALFEIFDV